MIGAPRVFFVTHGGPAVGLGHVCRCLALARAFIADGAEVRFLVNPDEHVAAFLHRASMEAVEVPWVVDPHAALEPLSLSGPDVIVVDSYAASAEFLASLRSVAGQVVAVDDLADRFLPVHAVVNGGVAAEALGYRASPDTVFLLGPRYALVDPLYAAAPGRSTSEPVRRIFVSLGGGQHPDATAAALAAADAVVEDASVDVVVGPFATRSPELDATTRRARDRVVVHRNLSSLRELMLAADVAISGGGMTLYELAATATPTVVIRMADNQAGNVDGFERAGAALGAGSADGPGLGFALEWTLRRLVGDSALRAAVSARARALVDGQGALRVAREVARPAISRR